MREVQKESGGKVVYVTPLGEQNVLQRLSSVFGEQGLGLEVGALVQGSEKSSDNLRILNESDIVVSAPGTWEYLSRKWRSR